MTHTDKPDWADEIALKLCYTEQQRHSYSDEWYMISDISTALRKAKADGFREAAGMADECFERGLEHEARDRIRAQADKIEKGQS